MNDEAPTFIFADFCDMFFLRYCETEDQALSMCMSKNDVLVWHGPGIYYTEKTYYNSSMDSYYKIYKMSNDDVKNLLSFCDEIKNKLVQKQLKK